MKTRWLPFLLVCLGPPSGVAATPIEDAQSSYRTYDVAKAEALARSIVADPISPAGDRGAAEVMLARIAWLVDAQGKAAADRLSASLPADPRPCRGAVLLGRILNGGERAGETAHLLAPYVRRCARLDPGVTIEAARGSILVAAALPPARRGPMLAIARMTLARMPPIARARLETARDDLDIGLLVGDGRAALAGWRDYLWLKGTNRPQGFAQSNAAIGAAFVDGARPQARAVDAIALTELLVRAGFADEARQVIVDHRLAGSLDPRFRAVSAYLAMRAKLQQVILAHDRAYARNPHEDADRFEKIVLGILREGVEAAGEVPANDPWPQLQALWGLHGQTGVINGVSGLMAGHAVEDRNQAVVQENRRGSIRYIAIDNMIADSFSTWLWDDNIGPAGWASGGALIYQVRPLYALGTLHALAIGLPGPARDEASAEAKAATTADAGRLHGSDPVPLPGLGDRLMLQAVDQLAMAVRGHTKKPDDFMAAFRRAWWDENLASSIFLHEGRHVLDEIEYKGKAELDGPELEYRGKLSEIGYSRLPRIGLAGVVGAELNAGSSHGIANARIMALYRDWVAAHSAEVAAFDPARPAALQIDRLTDDQIRRIAHDADPELHRRAGD